MEGAEIRAGEGGGVTEPTLGEILFMVGSYFGVSETDLKSDRRERRVSWPRQLYCLLARELTDKSYNQIAMKIGGRDHSTVIYAVRASRERVKADDEYAECYRCCMREFGRLV